MKKSQITYAIWPWGTETKEQAELAAKEISEIGFKSFESVKQAIYAYNLDVNEYKALLEKYGIKAESFYFHLPEVGNEDSFFSNLEHELDFVAKMGVSRTTLQGVFGRPEGDIMDGKSREHNLNLMVKFADIAKKFGINTNVHPHVNTYFMYEDEINYVMENTDKNLIYFAPDTAHIAAAGADPVNIIKKYADRINFIHLKDYRLGDEVTSQGWVDSGVPIMSCFHELGMGTVDFPEVINILDSVNYDGPLCIELDNPPVSNVKSAKKNFEFLSKLLED